MENIVRKVITEHQRNVLLSELYAECLDIAQLKEEQPLGFKDINNMFDYLLYNYFDIEVVKDIIE